MLHGLAPVNWEQLLVSRSSEYTHWQHPSETAELLSCEEHDDSKCYYSGQLFHELWAAELPNQLTIYPVDTATQWLDWISIQKYFHFLLIAVSHHIQCYHRADCIILTETLTSSLLSPPHLTNGLFPIDFLSNASHVLQPFICNFFHRNPTPVPVPHLAVTQTARRGSLKTLEVILHSKGYRRYDVYRHQGRRTEISSPQMKSFTDYALSIFVSENVKPWKLGRYPWRIRYIGAKCPISWAIALLQPQADPRNEIQ